MSSRKVAVQRKPGQRADARRNHERLLDSAAATYLNEGPNVPMEKIARNACVGVGTLYRHFPDRNALAQALTDQAFETVATIAKQAHDHLEDDPLEAIRFFLFGVIEQQDKMVLPLTGGPVNELQRNDGVRREIRGHLEAILDAGRKKEIIRQDVTALDVMILGAYLVRRLPNLPNGRLMAFRQAQIYVDGLRASNGSSGETLPAAAEFERGYQNSIP